MESGFLQKPETGYMVALEGCFYPCFNGIRVLTPSHSVKALQSLNVSILVLMESGFLPSIKEAKQWAKDRFLSLF